MLSFHGNNEQHEMNEWTDLLLLICLIIFIQLFASFFYGIELVLFIGWLVLLSGIGLGINWKIEGEKVEWCLRFVEFLKIFWNILN